MGVSNGTTDLGYVNRNRQTAWFAAPVLLAQTTTSMSTSCAARLAVMYMELMVPTSSSASVLTARAELRGSNCNDMQYVNDDGAQVCYQ